jgi:hypothetical protein
MHVFGRWSLCFPLHSPLLGLLGYTSLVICQRQMDGWLLLMRTRVVHSHNSTTFLFWPQPVYL